MEFIGIQKLSMVDYDAKLACTLFAGGCNFRCPFCHNSELVELDRNVSVLTMDEILKFLKTRVGLLDAVVISGGEPTFMSDLKERIIEIRKLGFLIKLDTNGSNPDVVKDLVNSGLVDYIAMDIKTDLEHYPEVIGKDEFPKEKIIETIRFLLEGHVDYEFRTTLVNEYHNIENIKLISKLINGAKKYCLQKFVESDTCFSKDLHPVSQEDVSKFKTALLPYIKNVVIRGYDE